MFIDLSTGKKIRVSDFVISLTHGNLTGIVNGNPRQRVALFNLSLAHATLKAGQHSVRASGIGVSLTKTAAGALDAALGTKLFSAGLKLGTASHGSPLLTVPAAPPPDHRRRRRGPWRRARATYPLLRLIRQAAGTYGHARQPGEDPCRCSGTTTTSPSRARPAPDSGGPGAPSGLAGFASDQGWRAGR